MLICAVLLLGGAWAQHENKDRDKDRGRRGAGDGRALVVAQISDTHIGLAKAPNAPEQLRRVVEMVNQRRPDVVLVTGDIGERPDAWRQAREILGRLQAPVKYIPGNHDVNGRNEARYVQVFGANYYAFRMRNVTFFMLDSQLLGNYDRFEAHSPEPMSPEAAAAGDEMLEWLKNQKAPAGDAVIVVQHIPSDRGGNQAPDPKPYWTTQEPYRGRELEIMKRLGVQHEIAGHWHKQVLFDAGGIHYHVAPATSWAVAGPLGFAMHTITPEGDVRSEFVPLQ
ncbi:MAG TPA: metallophosphoesterase [Terriglobales bacterium]|nr:metallophosphoesterase [Terriglobales bacterium]